MRTVKSLLVVLFLLAFAGLAQAQNGTQGPSSPGAVPVAPPVERADACNQVAHSHSTGATLTLTAGGAGTSSGSIYICGMDITNCQGSAVTAAAPTFITTTGINGNPQFMIGSGPATAGTCTATPIPEWTAPLKSATSGTNVTFVLPAFITNQTVSVNVYYRTGY